jgi:hypothetical protein
MIQTHCQSLPKFLKIKIQGQVHKNSRNKIHFIFFFLEIVFLLVQVFSMSFEFIGLDLDELYRRKQITKITKNPEKPKAQKNCSIRKILSISDFYYPNWLNEIKSFCSN